MFKAHLLSLLISTSLASSIILSVLGACQYTRCARWFSFVMMTVCASIGIYLLLQFNPQQIDFQFQESSLWLSRWNIHYALGVDSIALSLIVATLFTTFVLVLINESHAHQPCGYRLAIYFLVQALLIGSFAATDAILFYICWEAVLVPLLFIIGLWGSQARAQATLKFFMYTFLGSMGLLLAFIYLGAIKLQGDFNIVHWHHVILNWNEQLLIFIAFLFAFAVKTPIWPLHTWLPTAHTEAPTEGSILLAALMLKLGGYGFLRFCLPILPDAVHYCAPFICVAGIIAMLYAGLAALAQNDIKKVMAYSSISHMGMIVLGIFLVFMRENNTIKDFTPYILGLSGAMIHMIAHVMSTIGFFLVAGILYQRFETRHMGAYSGLAKTMPMLAVFFMVCSLSNLGLPGTAGFVGELLIIMQAMQANIAMSLFAALSLVISAAYTLRLYANLFFGPHENTEHNIQKPLQNAEKVVFMILMIAIVGIGVWPSPLMRFFQPALQNILILSLNSKL